MGKNVAVFVDVANIFYAAKAAGVDIDYVTLLKSAIAGRDFVRAYAYTGLDPDNENQRNFHQFLARHGYKVVSKDIRKYGDGKVKANLDIELVVDMMKTARNLDVAIVVSGDGDFAPAIRAVQEMGVRVEVISFRGNTSSDLIDVADIFTDIAQIAKVERESSRSGRRVAEAEEFDLSMTEVPDKLTEGTGRPRGRGRGRARVEDVVAAPTRAPIRREAARDVAPVATAEADAAAPLVVLPGEKLSRAGRGGRTARAAAVEEGVLEAGLPVPVGAAQMPDEDENLDGQAATADGADLSETGERRRRRRRGGRGRGRGRGRTDEGLEEGAPEVVAEPGPARREPIAASRPASPERRERALPVEEDLGPRGPRPTPFGSVWDSQLGVPSAPAANLAPLSDEDEDEPAIPEYLLAERHQGGGRGPVRAPQARGQRAGYAAAVDRERYGRGGPTGGINRYPDVGDRGRGQRPGPRRDDRPPMRPQSEVPARTDRPARSSEPWSEVPPEIEEMLRAQLAARPRRPEGQVTPARSGSTAETAAAVPVPETAAGAPSAPAGAEATASAPARGRGRRRPAAPDGESPTAEASVAAVPAPEAPVAAPRGRARRVTAEPVRASAEPVEAAPAQGEPASPAAPKAPRRRTVRATDDAVSEASAAPESRAGTPAPEPAEPAAGPRRATRRKASPPPQ